MSDLLIVALLFLISSVGILVHLIKSLNQRILHLLIALGGGSMLSVSLVHILPESMEQSNWSIYAFVIGFLLIYILEELLTPHHHDHYHEDHTHEDPHEHFKHVVIVAWIAIVIHTLFDGFGIEASFTLGEELGMSVLLGVAIHQIPVSLSVGSLLRESPFHGSTQVMMMLVFALSAPLGFIFTSILFQDMNPASVGIASALAGGSLLYVTNVELLPMIHAQSNKKMKYATVLLFLIGAVGMSSMAFLE